MILHLNRVLDRGQGQEQIISAKYNEFQFVNPHNRLPTKSSARPYLRGCSPKYEFR